MKKIRWKDTGLEVAMEKLLNEHNIPYIKQPTIYGRPDFLIVGTHVVVFCDSSFWHGRRRREITGEAFHHNRDFWTNKLKQNKKRDRQVNSKLKSEGWVICRFWDTDILNNPATVIEKLKRALQMQIEISEVIDFC